MMRAPGGRWWIVFASMLALLVGNGPVMQFTMGTLLPPITREFGWSRGVVSSAMVTGLWMTALATPFLGRLVDRFGIRAVALPAIALFSLATAAAGLAPASPMALTAVYAFMGVGAACQTPLIYAKAISSRFDRERGIALGVAISGVGVGATLVPRYVQALVEGVGWRGAYAGLAALIFVLAFPTVAFFVGRPAEERRPAVWKSAASSAPGLTGFEALRTARFWILSSSFLIAAATTGGVLAHLVPLLEDRGVPAQVATDVLGVSGAALIVGRILSGFLLDRIHARYVAALFFLSPLIGIVVLLVAGGPREAAAGVMLIGLGLGAEGDLMAFLVSRYLGIRSFGEIYGYFFSIFMLGAGVGPLAMGLWFDRARSYNGMLLFFAGALAIASLPMVRLGTYVYPAAQERDGGAPAPVGPDLASGHSDRAAGPSQMGFSTGA